MHDIEITAIIGDNSLRQRLKDAALNEKCRIVTAAYQVRATPDATRRVLSVC